MPGSYTLDAEGEAFIQAQLASGRYRDASDVLREALRLLEARERRLAELDAAIARGIADGEAGRIYDLDEVFDDLDERLGQGPVRVG